MAVEPFLNLALFERVFSDMLIPPNTGSQQHYGLGSKFSNSGMRSSKLLGFKKPFDRGDFL
jgi:hypothetical protein